MRTWSEAAGISAEIRKQMGRWSPTIDQGYERTWRSNTIRAQAKVADFVRRSIGKQDPFDEALIMGAIADRMEQIGFPGGVIAIQMEKLAVFGKGRPRKLLRLGEPDQVWEEGPVERDWNLVGQEAEEEAEERDGQEKSHEGLSSDEDKDVHQEADELVPRGSFVISIWGRGNRKTLHRVGECHRVPGVHYKNYEVVGNDPPASDTFHQSCRVCFPRGAAVEESDSEASDEEASSSDSSTSVDESED